MVLPDKGKGHHILIRAIIVVSMRHKKNLNSLQCFKKERVSPSPWPPVVDMSAKNEFMFSLDRYYIYIICNHDGDKHNFQHNIRASGL